MVGRRTTAHIATEHRQMLECGHAAAAIARVHFGAARTESRLTIGDDDGRYVYALPNGRFVSAWSDGLVAVASLAIADPNLARVELFSADCPQSLRELVTEARGEGFVATGIKWMDSDGDLHAVGAADHLAVGSEAGSGLGRRPYRPPGGREALAHEQEMLVGLFGSLPLASMHRVSSHEADIILGLPYEGGGEAISPYDVEHAVEMLAQVRVVWRTWKEDVDRTRAGARREGAATTPDEELVLAIMQDDLLGLERALQRGAKVDAPIISKRFAPIARYTPSLLALGYPAMLEALLQHGANPNVEFPWGSSLLGLAIARERTDALDLLLRHGVDPRADARPYDLLRAALRANNLSILKVLLDAGAPLDPSPPNPGVPHVREQLARWTRRSGDEALALRIENMPLG